MICYIVLIIMTLIGSFASYFFKKASGTSNFIMMLRNINLYLGGFLYLFSAILNIYVLRYLDYSVVLPLTSITYIWTMFLSYKLLNEKISKNKLIGVFMIFTGAILISI